MNRSYPPIQQLAFLVTMMLLPTSGLAMIGLMMTVPAVAEEGAAEEGAAEEGSPVVGPIAQRLEITPARISIESARHVNRALVTAYYEGGYAEDLTRDAELSTADPNVAEVVHGVVTPTGNGTTTMIAKIGEQSAMATIEVTGFTESSPVSFRTESVAVLTRQGCNAGSCHGAPSGKGGFRLSLEAFDHSLDQNSLTRDAMARRTNALEPDESLLLLKPLMQAAHGGGLRLSKGEYTHALLRQWISEGSQVDEAAGKTCVKLELLPESGRVLQLSNAKQQLVALAHYDDGTQRDVTQITKFSSSNSDIATVSMEGLIAGQKRGHVAVMARYLSQLVSCNLTFVPAATDYEWTVPPESNYIDKFVNEKLHQLQYTPSELCSDSVFLRRVYLDVVGTLPTPEQVKAFLADQGDDRRQRVIDELLDRPDYARYWALKWGDLLRLKQSEVKKSGVAKYYDWLVDVFDTNMPFDEFARQLLTSQGSTYAHPAANYFRACDNMEEATETTAQLFLGSRIQCAKCHNHPFENWTQDNYYGLSAFFNRVQNKPGSRFEENIVYLARDGEVNQPRTGQQMKPWLPVRGELDNIEHYDRRTAFVDWLTADDNPFFSQVAVNRVWAHLLGRGIVEPVDDFRASNPPAIPALLETLAEDFREHDYDQKHLIRTILKSRTYQRTSRPNESNVEDTVYFSHATVRMLTAEQLLDAICQVTDVAEAFPGLPAGTLATQLPSPDFDHSFLQTFGKPARSTACACERTTEATLAQAIQMFNGEMIHKKVGDQQNRFHRLLTAEQAHDEIVRQLYLAALGRPPIQEELDRSLEHIGKKEKPGEGFEDVCWALLNTNEFLTQH